MEVIYQKREKLRNENRTFRFLVDINEFTKLEISQYLNMSIPTISKILDKFLKNKLILEVGTENGKLGRKAVRYKFNPDAYFSIGIKIEKDYISMILMNLAGNIVKKSVVQEKFINEENFIFLITNELKKFLWEFDRKELLKGIGIVMPGIVDPSSPLIKIGGNFSLFNESMEEIEEEFNLPIYLDNEANAGAVGEYLTGNYEAEDIKNMLYLSIDTGIGSGIIIDKLIYRGGKGNKAGEIGHIPIVPKGRECVCGSRGCLEQYCSNTALIKYFEEAFDCKIAKYEDIFQEKFVNDPKGQEILKEYAENLAVGLKSAMLMLNPDKIIIGGKISDYSEYFEENLKEALFNDEIFYRDSNILEFSKLSDTAPLLGAAFSSFRDLYRTVGE